MDFFNALSTYSFLQNAVVAALFAAVSCGISGTFVHINRITFIAGGIAHAVLGGVGAAVFFGFPPFAGAIATALIFAVLLGIIRLKAMQHEDTVIGAMWACGMSAGIIFIYLTPGYAVNLNNYLFGNILLVSKSDITALSVLAALVILVSVLFFRQFKAVSFDEENATLHGVKASLIYILMLSVIALTVVLMKVVGLILVIAFMTLPAATAAIFQRKVGGIIVLSIILSFIFSMSGLFVSYTWNLPTGAVITLVSGAVYAVALLCSKLSR